MTQTFQTTGVPQSLGLSKLVAAWLDRRRERPRSAGFHPSEADRLCPVLERLVERANDAIVSGDPAKIERGFAFRRAVLEAKRFPSNLKHEFLLGSAIHASIQFHMGVLGFLWGVWECPACGARTTEGAMPRTQVEDARGQLMWDAAPCRSCDGRNYRYDTAWAYIEPSVGDTQLGRELGVTGNMDGDFRFFREGVWFRYVLEVKSINDAGWSGKRGFPLPKPEHIQQASIYAALKGISYILFIYVNKDQVSEWKEIVVPADLEVVGRFRQKIDNVLRARAEGQLPLHARACGDHRDERARACPGVRECFGVSEVPDARWTVKAGR